MVHVRLPYRITLILGTLAILAGCGGDASQRDLDALRQEVADLKQMQSQMQTALASFGAGPNMAAARPEASDRPKRDAVRRIPINFAPRKGSNVAAVTVVEFADFQCPVSKQNADLPDKLLAEFPNDLQFAFKHFPLGKHPHATDAAKAAWAAHQQGKFWEMYDTIYAGEIQNLSSEVLRGYAERIGLDMAKYDADVASEEATRAVAIDKKLARAVRAGGTPLYFVNGKRVKDASPESVRAKVQEELEAFRAKTGN